MKYKNFNFKYIKELATPGSWRRGYEYYKKKMVLSANLSGNQVVASVKGSFQDSYDIKLNFDKEGVKANCSCPLEEEWCKHAVSVGIYSIENHFYEQFLKKTENEIFEFPEETPESVKEPQGSYKFEFNPDLKPKFIGIRVIDRNKNETVKDIESILRAVIALQKASEGSFELNDAQKNEFAVMQFLYKRARFQKDSEFYSIPFNFMDEVLNLLSKVEEVIDSSNGKRLIFTDKILNLVLSVNVSLVGNVLLSLHWKRTDKDEILPFEEVRYYSKHTNWGKYKQIVFPTNIKIIKLPSYLTKTTFTDIRDAEGGKFVYEELPKLKEIMPVEISEVIEKLSLEQRPPKNIVNMEFLEGNKIKASLEFEYDGTRVPYTKQTDISPYVTVKKPEEDLIYWVKRDLKNEQQSYNSLLACKFYPMQTNNLQIEEDDAIDFYNFYKPRAGDDWVFEENGDFSSIKVLPNPLLISANLDFEKSADSFLMEIKMLSGDMEISTDKVLQAFMHGKKYMEADQKGFIEIPLTAILNFTKSLSSFDAIKDNEKDIYRIKTYRAGLVNELIEQNVQIQMSKKFEKFWTQIKSFNELEEIKKPKGLKADLREYQNKGLNWLWFLYEYGLNGILADDMGLGKTVQTLSLIQKAKEKDGKQPTLVVCPTSVVFNWEAEIEKFTPGLKSLNLTGSARKDLFTKIDKSDVVITSYALLRRDIEKLKGYNFRHIILDESQNIKNADSITAQSSKQLNAQHRLALSGTPIENNINELWSVFDFLMPGFLYDDSEFKSRYAIPIQEREDRLVESRLKKQIYPFILRRMKRDIAKDLPDKVENVAYCSMLPEQREFYLEVLDNTKKELLAKVQKDGIEKNQMSIFAALLRLRQISCHPRLYDKEGERGIETSGKFEHLKEMLEEIISEGHRILLFSQFVQMLDIIRDWLKEKGIKHEYLTGSTKDRADRVNRFNEDESIPVFLISLKAGGTGLNLTGADYVIHYDPWWNPAVEDQATDRAYRIGQTKNVFVYRFITKGTVEEKIMKLKEKKRDLADTIISTDRAIGKALTYEDLEDIFSVD